MVLSKQLHKEVSIAAYASLSLIWASPQQVVLVEVLAQMVEESCPVGCAESQDCRCQRAMSVLGGL